MRSAAVQTGSGSGVSRFSSRPDQGGGYSATVSLPRKWPERESMSQLVAALRAGLFPHLLEAAAQKLPRRDGVSVAFHCLSKLPEGFGNITSLQRVTAEIAPGGGCGVLFQAASLQPGSSGSLHGAPSFILAVEKTAAAGIDHAAVFTSASGDRSLEQLRSERGVRQVAAGGRLTFHGIRSPEPLEQVSNR